eukprot:SAG31_NODE_439_length_15675_cov_6.578390_10_plen_189_part_00
MQAAEDVKATVGVEKTVVPNEFNDCEICCHACPTEEEVNIKLECPGGVPAAINAESSDLDSAGTSLAGKAVVFPAQNFWLSQEHAKTYALYNFSVESLRNHSCEQVKGEPICIGFHIDLSVTDSQQCNNSLTALQPPYFCAAGHTGALCASCLDNLTRMHTGRCCDPNIGDPELGNIAMLAICSLYTV